MTSKSTTGSPRGGAGNTSKFFLAWALLLLLLLAAPVSGSYIDDWEIQEVELFSGTTQVRDIDVTPDGETLYFTGVYEKLGKCSISGFNISTADCSILTAPFVHDFGSMDFTNDGQYVFVRNGSLVCRYDLDEAYNITSDESANLFSCSSINIGNLYGGLDVSQDGKYMYSAQTSGDQVQQYVMSTPYDPSTASYNGSFILPAGRDDPSGIKELKEGQWLLIIDSSDEALLLYNLTIPYDVNGGVSLIDSEVFFSTLTNTYSFFVEELSGNAYIGSQNNYIEWYSTPSTLTGNVAPSLSSVSLSPSDPLDNDTLTGTCSASDADGDNLTVYVDWYKNDALVDSDVNVTGLSSGSLIGGTYSVLSYEDEVYFSCTVSDGVLNSTTLNSSTVTVNLSDYSLTAFEVLDPCSYTVTLNSTGVPVTFNWTASSSPADYSITYDVFTTNLAGTTIASELNTTHYDATLQEGDYLSSSYTAVVQASDGEGNLRNASCAFSICKNDWVSTLSTCAYNGTSDVYGIQYLTYSDQNTCPESYDVPIDNGTSYTCLLDTGAEELVTSETALRFEFWLYLILIGALTYIGTRMGIFMVLAAFLLTTFSFYARSVTGSDTLFIWLLILSVLQLMVAIIMLFSGKE